ncbi:3-oxo-5-alpha-steroid 4-dehydrogenase-domain-containing protein, partial [Rhodofomes roseus]
SATYCNTPRRPRYILQYTLTSPLDTRIHPVSRNSPGLVSSNAPHVSSLSLLGALLLLHYLNRALISPLRTPSRSKSHIIVPLSALAFNLTNGSLLGAYFSSPAAQAYLANAFARPSFWVGLALWAAGLAGNILHDEVLLNIRRTAKAKGKGRASPPPAGKGQKQSKQEHYAIPHGYLYRFISYPNYFCEWCEWLGFAIAAAPLPSFVSGADFLATVAPPWLFFMSEIFLMLPRAWQGHRWYRARFPDYPKERKVVIPFLF